MLSSQNGKKTASAIIKKNYNVTKMLNRMLNQTNEDDSDDAVVEVATKTEYTLARTQANRAAVNWSKYKLYDSRLHPEKKTFAVCKIPGCGKEISFKCGNGGLGRHLQFKHQEVYDELYGLDPRLASHPQPKLRPQLTPQ